MRSRSTKRLFTVVLIFANNVTRTVHVKASDREVAENRALKRNPNAVGVQRHA